MDRDKAMELLRGGAEGIAEWNRRRKAGEVIPDLDRADLAGANLEGADLRGADLRGAILAGADLTGAHLRRARLITADLTGSGLAGAHLSEADLTGAHLSEADLRGAILVGADLQGADLTGADLQGAHLSKADLSRADLSRANLIRAELSVANLIRAHLSEADLRGANLEGADLQGADLRGADLRGADLRGADLQGADLQGADLTGAYCNDTNFINVNLSEVKGIDSIGHFGPSHVSTSTLIRSRRKVPEAFLRGCGLAPWEVLSANLYDPAMTPPRVADLQYLIFDAWTKGRSMINGCFISYSWKDARFVDKLRDRLVAEGVNVWLDRHDMVAGTIQDQVWRAIQIHHVVLLVLSKDSTQSDWVENELDMARSKEKAEGRAVLCPVALDDAWRAKVEAKGGPGDPSRQLWRTLQQKLVVDFSRWRTKAFEEAFEKLLRGLKVSYGP